MLSSNREKYVTDLQPADVLFGRGSGPNDHEGNIRFRQLVAERKAEYMATNHRLTKAKIAKEIVDQVFALNGRFMKKVETAELAKLGLPEGTDVWEVVDGDTIEEKAKQALRQNSQKAKDDASRQRSKSPKRKSKSPVRNRSGPAVTPVGNYDPLPLQSGGAYNMPGQGQSLMPPPPQQQPQMAMPVNSAQSVWSNHTGGAYQQPQEQRPSQQHRMAAPPPRHMQAVEVDPDSMLGTFMRANSNDLMEPNNVGGMVQMPSQDLEDRRASLSLAELQKMHGRRHSIERKEYAELMDSFTKMKTADDAAGEKSQQMYGSGETMGTIEHMNPGSMADMSIGTMNSSTFSFFPGNQSTLDEKEGQDGVGPMREMSLGSLGMPHGASMSLSDVWSSRRKSSASTNVSGGIFSSSSGDNTASLSFQPRPVGLMEEQPDGLSLDAMGSSSMAILKSTMGIESPNSSPTGKATSAVPNTVPSSDDKPTQF